MKNYLFLVLFLIGSALSAQAQPNRFSEEEQQSVNSSSAADDAPTGGPGTGSGDCLECDDLPIDDYIPLLVLTALGIIIYKTRKNRNLLS